jgi:hypothetical protein
MFSAVIHFHETLCDYLTLSLYFKSGSSSSKADTNEEIYVLATYCTASLLKL